MIYIYIYIYIRDVLLWIPTHGRAKAGRPSRTYIQQLCEDTGCCPEDLPRAMNDREEWRDRVRDIRATSAIWWWWYIRVLQQMRGIFLQKSKMLFFSMPSTGTTSCHPKNLLCRSERHSALDTQNYTVTLNTSLTRPTTRCHLNISLSHFVSNIQQA